MGHNIHLPDNREKLLNLPGVGDYIAGAMLTTAFNKKSWWSTQISSEFLKDISILKQQKRVEEIPIL